MNREKLRSILKMSDKAFNKYVRNQNSMPAGEIMISRYECKACGEQFDKTNVSINATINKCPHCGDLRSNNKEFVTYVNFLKEFEQLTEEES